MLQKGTWKGPACWVCGVRFKTSVPPGPANREDHHIFPRNAGGTDGPEVSLCSEHHSTLHKIAQRLHRKAPFADLLLGEQQSFHKKLLWLAAAVVKAENFAKGDPNKLLRNGVQLDAAETAMIQRLQKATGKTRQEIFQLALRVLYSKYFPSK